MPFGPVLHPVGRISRAMSCRRRAQRVRIPTMPYMAVGRVGSSAPWPSVSAPTPCRVSGSVVADPGDELCVLGQQFDMCPGTVPGMFEHIRQRLLNDAVDGERRSFGQAAAVDVIQFGHRDRKPRRSHIGDEGADVGDTGQRRRRALVVLLGAEEAEQRSVCAKASRPVCAMVSRAQVATAGSVFAA